LAIVERAKAALRAESHPTRETAMVTLASTTQIVAELIAQRQGKESSLERLRRMLFGAPTEKTEQVLGEECPGAVRQDGAQSASGDGATVCYDVRHMLQLPRESCSHSARAAQSVRRRPP